MEPVPVPAPVPAPPSASPLLVEGHTCWRLAPARRVCFLVDADAYFDAFAAAAQRAQRSLLVVGWDFDSRTPLWRRSATGRTAPPLGDFLTALVLANPDLHVHVLEWEFSLLYSKGRELPPRWGLGWRHHERIHVELDGHTPLGTCHHQKIVVVDDALAFVGGLDLTRQRWDTPEHRADHPRRLLDGNGYPPFHDAVMAVDGAAAAALAELVRTRWFLATGQRLAPVRVPSNPWPRRLPVDVTNVDIGIARTLARPAVREVEALHLALIQRARRLLYAENQYFTSSLLVQALAARLQEPEGPEVVLVLRRNTAGVLAGPSMDLLRTHRLEQLQAADRYRRLHVVYPVSPGLGGQFINVHSKVMMADDDAVRVGSANLANRSLSLDSECDLALEAHGDPRVQRAVARFRHRLLGEHLDLAPGDVARAEAALGSLGAVLRSRQGHSRSLQPLPPGRAQPELLRPLVERLCDPLEPPSLRAAWRQWRRRPVSWRAVAAPLGVVAFLLGSFLAWRLTPLRELASPEHVLEFLHGLHTHPAAPLLLALLYTAALFTGFPRPLLTAAAAVSFGPWRGFAYALLGISVSALASYAVGRRVSWATVQRWAGPRLPALTQLLQRQGGLTMAVVHVLPVAPAILVNLVAGALRVRVVPFAWGTALGHVPGTLFTCVLSHQVGRMLGP